MPNYRRNWVLGGTYFFTVALLVRERDLLVAEIELLRESVRRVKRLYPFEIVAWVVLPDHCIAFGRYRKVMPITQPDGACSNCCLQRAART